MALVASGVGWLLAMYLGFSKHGQGMSFRSSKSTSPIMVDVVGLKISTAALASTLVAMLVANATPTAAGWL